MRKFSDRKFIWGEFMLGFLVGTILLVVGFLIIYLYQLDYLQNINKRLINIENKLASYDNTIPIPQKHSNEELEEDYQKLPEQYHDLRKDNEEK
ncbi:MAG TPA: hypothetical protein P5543_00865 [Planctomycetota bacterium]|nr:hypothetical protein [Planctomycetota bacterium]